MKALYVTSIHKFSGKTAVCLAIGRRLQRDGHKVGYLKPVSSKPWEMGGRVADEDAGFVKETLGLEADAWELAPVVITPSLLEDTLRGRLTRDLAAEVRSAVEEAGKGQDVLLLEGGASLREGYAIGLSTPDVAHMLGVCVLEIVKFEERLCLLDDVLTARARIGDLLAGVILNRIPPEELEFTDRLARPFLEGKGVRVLGILPERPQLAAISVGELIQTLKAQVLAGEDKTDQLVETLMVGAMTVEAALARFRRQQNKAIITGGDRTDIQLAALETSTTCMILTGNLHPSPSVVRRAAEQGVAVLLVPTNTMETVENVERVFGKTRLGQSEKLATFEALMEQHVDYNRLFEVTGL
jgi:BioD-like phosphotransacetylase family protein